MKAYKIKVDSALEEHAKAGTVVYPCVGYDYGTASDDTRFTGKPHKSVTLDKLGGYPFFTVPEEDLEPYEAPDIPALTNNHIDIVCRPGAGSNTCRYLMVSPQGFECGKVTVATRGLLDAKARNGDMVAVSDNCEGRTGYA